jgi:glycosyltransferase involved in cell wall biosynthesis
MEVGGAERVVSLLCRGQREGGHTPSVYCLYAIGALGEELRRDGFEVVLLGPASAIGLALRLYRSFQIRKPDVVHCHNATATILAAAPARLAARATVISTRHGLVEPPFAMAQEMKFVLAARFCHAVVAVCESAAKNLRMLPFSPGAKIRIIRNGSPELPISVGTASRRNGEFVVLNVGRLSPAKDQATLLRAFSLAREHVPNLALRIVGDGPLRLNLEQLARELQIDPATCFVGEQRDMAAYYSSASLFVMSSVTEGLPMALLEAMSAGVPAVVTNVGGMAEIVGASECGAVVPPCSPSDLAHAIAAFASNPALLATAAAAARDVYRRQYTADSMFTRYLMTYSR